MAGTARGILGKFDVLLRKVPLDRRYAIPVLFAAFSLPIFVLIAFIVVRSEQGSATRTLIRATEVQNEALAQTLANSHIERFSYLLAFDIGDAPELIPIALERAGLEQKVRASLRDSNVKNLKLYDGRGTTLFSLNADDLGDSVASCACFDEALGGATVSDLLHIGHGDSRRAEFDVGDLHDGDVLATMIRMSVLAPDLVAPDGIVEVHADISDMVPAIYQARQDILLQVGGLLALLYALMVAIVMLVHSLLLRREQEAIDLARNFAESEATSRAKSELLALMSQELRAPVKAIIGFSELIDKSQMEDEDSDVARYARTIHESGHHMLRQIASIQDLTAIELGELGLEVQPLRLDDVVSSAARDVRPVFDKNLVILDVAPSEPLPLVLGDAEKLRQSFENLLGNAARFTAAGGEVKVDFAVAEDNAVCVRIHDSGVGMTRDEIARARLPFEQNAKGMRRGEGAGLGLTIADHLVAQLGGRLEIESEEGRGTTVTVRLPEYRPRETGDESPELSADELAASLTGIYATRLPASYNPEESQRTWLTAEEIAEGKSIAAIYASRMDAA